MTVTTTYKTKTATDLFLALDIFVILCFVMVFLAFVEFAFISFIGIFIGRMRYRDLVREYTLPIVNLLDWSLSYGTRKTPTFFLHNSDNLVPSYNLSYLR